MKAATPPFETDSIGMTLILCRAETWKILSTRDHSLSRLIPPCLLVQSTSERQLQAPPQVRVRSPGEYLTVSALSALPVLLPTRARSGKIYKTMARGRYLLGLLQLSLGCQAAEKWAQIAKGLAMQGPDV